MSRPVPYVVLAVLLICTLIWLFDGIWSSIIYNRDMHYDLWRYFTASFVHYDFKHLITNLLAFAILGVFLEPRDSRLRLLGIMLTTIVLSMLCLRFYLQQYQVYAGLSGVNYALLGYIIIDRYRGSLWELGSLLLLIGAYQLAIIAGVDGYSMDTPRPVWQLHVLALVVGGLFAVWKTTKGNMIDSVTA